MQEPPDPAKSQTVTNSMAQALADGKKSLPDSEKMEALYVAQDGFVFSYSD